MSIAWIKSLKFRTEFTLIFDENGNLIKEKSDRIPCGIPDWFGGMLTIFGVLVGIVGLILQAFD